MSSAHALLTRPPLFRPEEVMGLAVKQLHWQLLATNLLLRGQDLASGLRKLGASRNAETVRPRMWSKMSLRQRELAQQKCAEMEAAKKEPKQELLTAEPMINNVVDFVQNRMFRLCPPLESDAHAWAFRFAIDRFLIGQRAMVELRLSKADAAVALLGHELRRLAL